MFIKGFLRTAFMKALRIECESHNVSDIEATNLFGEIKDMAWFKYQNEPHRRGVPVIKVENFDRISSDILNEFIELWVDCGSVNRSIHRLYVATHDVELSDLAKRSGMYPEITIKSELIRTFANI